MTRRELAAVIDKHVCEAREQDVKAVRYWWSVLGPVEKRQDCHRRLYEAIVRG